MTIVCRDYLIAKLKDAGVRVQPMTSLKRLKAWQDSRVAAVLFDGETFERSGSQKCFTNQLGAQQKRRKIFSREATFAVMIGDASPEKTGELFENFIMTLGKGIVINGNYTAIEIGDAEWADEDDSILKSKVGVNVCVKFIGGVYVDSGLARLDNIEIIDIRKETNNGKDNAGSGDND